MVNFEMLSPFFDLLIAFYGHCKLIEAILMLLKELEPRGKILRVGKCERERETVRIRMSEKDRKKAIARELDTE